MKLILMCFLLLPMQAFSQETVTLKNISTEYIFKTEVDYPSCLIAKHRKRARAKVLREYAIHSQKNPHYKDFFFVNDYLMNKYFFDHSMWNDEVILIKNVWEVDEKIREIVKAKFDTTYFFLTGDGVHWFERIGFFPKGVSFEIDQDSGLITTEHTTYYHDYCFPLKENELIWFAKSDSQYESTSDLIKNFLENKEGEGNEKN